MIRLAYHGDCAIRAFALASAALDTFVLCNYMSHFVVPFRGRNTAGKTPQLVQIFSSKDSINGMGGDVAFVTELGSKCNHFKVFLRPSRFKSSAGIDNRAAAGIITTAFLVSSIGRAGGC